MPGAPLFWRTAAHARHRTSLRRTLSHSAWNRRPGSALAARYSACCKARTGSKGALPKAAGLADTALTEPLPDRHHASTKQRPFPHRRLCCPPGSSSTTAASDAHPARHPLPGSAGYRARRSGDTIRRSPGRGGPLQFPPPLSGRSEPLTPGSPSRLSSRIFTASMAFTLNFGGSALPVSRPSGRDFNDAAGFASCYGPSVAPPKGLLTLGSGTGRFPRAASLLRGLLAATRTGLAPAGDDELTNSKIHLLRHSVTSRSAGRTKLVG